jgi:peroxiredoxin Q/BCP
MKISKIVITALLVVIVNVFSHAQNPTDFTLTSATDNSQFALNKAKGKYVALHFLLKTECPYCIKHTADYFSKAETLPNVIQVFIKPDTQLEIKEWLTKLPSAEQTKYPIYRDPEAQLATQFNIPGGYMFHNQIVHYPATILIDPDGKEVFRYVGKNNTDRYSFENLAAKVKELNKK